MVTPFLILPKLLLPQKKILLLGMLHINSSRLELFESQAVRDFVLE